MGKKFMKKVALLVVSFCSVMLLAGCVEVQTSGNSNNSYFSGETTTSAPKFTYEIEKQYAGDYNIGYFIEGLVKNTTSKDYSYIQIEFICYDKDGNNLGTAIDNSNNLLANQTWKFKAMFLGSNVEEIAKCEYHEITSW